MRLTDFRDDIHELFVDVFGSGPVTIVIDVYLDESLGVLAEPDKDGEDEGFLADGRMTHFEDGDEDFVQEDFDFFLVMLAQSYEAERRAADLHLRSHRL